VVVAPPPTDAQVIAGTIMGIAGIEGGIGEKAITRQRACDCKHYGYRC
jgi:hypothetical protein